MDLNGQLRLHERCNVRAVRVGREALPVLVVDDFLSSPQVLVEYAAQATFDAVTDASYPGRRAPLPGIYCFALRAFLGGFIEQAFGLPAARVVREVSHFSLVTNPPGELTAVQRMPHFDNPDPGQLAVLHYLCDSARGGHVLLSAPQHRVRIHRCLPHVGVLQGHHAGTRCNGAAAATLRLRRRRAIRAHGLIRLCVQPGAGVSEYRFAQRRYRP